MACACVIMRSNNKSLPIGQVSNVLRCETHELGRMAMLVVNHLHIKLQEFNMVNSFERVGSLVSIGGG